MADFTTQVTERLYQCTHYYATGLKGTLIYYEQSAGRFVLQKQEGKFPLAPPGLLSFLADDIRHNVEADDGLARFLALRLLRFDQQPPHQPPQ